MNNDTIILDNKVNSKIKELAEAIIEATDKATINIDKDIIAVSLFGAIVIVLSQEIERATSKYV
jgi:hypothetical protein